MHYQHLPSPVAFREDINGLRAWAVIAVLGFHFPLVGLSGGFVGVDVFFVISGYLMTSIVMSGLEKGTFSLWRFYLARARRILPALMVLIAFLLVIGWFWLPTPDYQALGASSTASLSFVANVYYWLSTSYFDNAAREKWLLHTWSLAVEAQFYLLFPVFLTLIWRYKPSLRWLTLSLSLLLLCSLALTMVLSTLAPSAAFYLLPTRGWELAAGGMVYLLARQVRLTKQQTRWLFGLGWLLMLAAMLLMNDQLPWPSYWAVIPVLGASFIVFSQRPNNKLTDNRLAQWLGDRSYSLYLWHWPLVVALYFTQHNQEWLWIISAMLLSLVLAALSYQWVEVPTRHYLSNKSFRIEMLTILSAGIVLCTMSTVIQHTAFKARLPAAVELAMAESLNQNPDKARCHDHANKAGTPSCLSGSGELGAIMWGDSHANALMSALTAAGMPAHRSSMEWSFSGCPSLFGAHSTPWRANARTFHCAASAQWAAQAFTQYPNIPVVIVTRTSHYLYGQLATESKANDQQMSPLIYFTRPIHNATDPQLQQAFTQAIVSTSCALAKQHPVYLMRPIPEMGVDVPKTLSRNILFNRGNADIKIALNDYYSRNQLVWAAQDRAVAECGVKILNPLPYLCDDRYCYGSQNGRPLYFDDDHLSEYGNQRLIPMFKAVFQSSPVTPP